MTKQFATDVYGPGTKGGPIERRNLHNDRLARERGMDKVSDHGEPPLVEPEFTVLTSPPYATSELIDLPLSGECE